MKWFTAFALSLWSGSAAQEYPQIADTLHSWLKQNMLELKKQEPMSPYFAAYVLHDSASWVLRTDMGGILNERSKQGRRGAVELRMGSPSLDQTHPMPEDFMLSGAGVQQTQLLSLDFNPQLWKRAYRSATELSFREAKNRYAQVQTALETNRQEDGIGTDFVPRPSIQNIPTSTLPSLDSMGRGQLIQWLTGLSAQFKNSKHSQYSEIQFEQRITRRLFVDINNHRVMDSDTLYSLAIVLSANPANGVQTDLVEIASFSGYPSKHQRDSLSKVTTNLISLFDSLYTAPLLEPQAVPALLEGKAAAVFIHEILGHRIESDRFRLSSEGNTFLSKQGKSIFPSFINIVDDATQRDFHGTPLNGHYSYDDEGTPAQRTPIVQKGKLVGFLANRSPGFKTSTSTGNGRSTLGVKPMTRMSNLILTSTQSTPDQALKDSLRALVRKKGLEYGLIIRELGGGYTTTSRSTPQAFKLIPYYVIQVFADGRPDRLARGLDMVGTPLVTLGHVVRTGTQPALFNGTCGAESGWLPVSALSPSLLFDKVEFEKTQANYQSLPQLQAPK